MYVYSCRPKGYDAGRRQQQSSDRSLVSHPETKRLASIEWLRMTVRRDHLNCGQECMHLSQRQNPSEEELEHCALNRV